MSLTLPGELSKSQIAGLYLLDLIQWVWGGVQKFAFKQTDVDATGPRATP